VDFQILGRSFATLLAAQGGSYAEVETMIKHEKSDIHVVYVLGMRDSILAKLDAMCDTIAGGLPEHVERPKEDSVTQEAADTFKEFVDH